MKVNIKTADFVRCPAKLPGKFFLCFRQLLVLSLEGVLIHLHEPILQQHHRNVHHVILRHTYAQNYTYDSNLAPGSETRRGVCAGVVFPSLCDSAMTSSSHSCSSTCPSLAAAGRGSPSGCPPPASISASHPTTISFTIREHIRT